MYAEIGREMSQEEQHGLDEKLASAQVCVKGGALIKFVIGRRRRHERFFKVEGVGAAPILKWAGGKSGVRTSPPLGSCRTRALCLRRDRAVRSRLVLAAHRQGRR